jgi:benzoylformate decarboxylase
MSTVRDATYAVLRSLGMTTIFGNPGSNELPFLDRLPSDFRYVLALHEGAGLAMADGYAQFTGQPVLVSLHAAAGVGQAMGCLVNAQVLGTPLVIMSGQQFRAMLTLEGQLTNRDAIVLPRPLVKWSFEAWCPRFALVLGLTWGHCFPRERSGRIESEWTARDRESKMFGGPARTFLYPG